MTREITFMEAAMEALAEEMRRDEKVFHMSTDAPFPLVEEFGESRVRATPIAESALTGMAIGAASSGFRPIVDWRQVTFAFVAMDRRPRRGAALAEPLFDVHEHGGAEDHFGLFAL